MLNYPLPRIRALVGAIDRQQGRADANQLALNALAAQGKSKDITAMLKKLNQEGR